MHLEADLMSGLQGVLQGMAEFSAPDVVVNNWTVLDQAGAAADAPFAILMTADSFESRMDTAVSQDTWQLPVRFYVAFDDWASALTAYRNLRDAVLATFNDPATNARSLGGIEGVSVNVIRADGPVTPYYLVYTPSDQVPEATPSWLYQDVVFELETF